MVATRGPSRIAAALSPGGTYRAVGGGVGVLLRLALGGLAYRRRNKSIGILTVPAGHALTARVAQLAVEGQIVPQLEDVLPLASVPDALRRTGEGAVKGKLVIRP
ncbi:MAG: zinc-binding dehydrogenase [Rhodobacteraceae bacterium]|nr:zinc-binding dehydrogenase [Paracoccaceae bacterium]